MTESLEVRLPANHAAERRYSASVLLEEFLGLSCVFRQEDRRDTLLTLAGSEATLVVSDDLLRSDVKPWCDVTRLPASPLPRWAVDEDLPEAILTSGTIPVLYGSPDPSIGWFGMTETGAWLGVDVFGSALFMLTRCEEVLDDRRDQHGRFPFRGSIAEREDLARRPIVNEYLEILWAVMMRLWPTLERRRRSYRLLISHDVDTPRWSAGIRPARAARSVVGDIIKRRDPGLAALRLATYVGGRLGVTPRDPFDTYGWLMDQSERHGATDDFYFKAASTHPRYDDDYPLDDPWMARLLREIHERGHGIGLHPSYGSFGRPAQVDREFAVLRERVGALGIEQQVWGGRQHYLRWGAPDSWQAWEDAGLSYDSSVGFAERMGFRAGTCYEFPVFNVRTGRPLALRERPLIVMEGSALDRAYMGLDHRQALEAMVDMSETCRRFGGDFVFLWHNSNLLTRLDRQVYSDVVEAAA
jgi:hypothetical protein